jgi:hypothetical protein
MGLLLSNQCPNQLNLYTRFVEYTSKNKYSAVIRVRIQTENAKTGRPKSSCHHLPADCHVQSSAGHHPCPPMAAASASLNGSPPALLPSSPRRPPSPSRQQQAPALYHLASCSEQQPPMAPCSMPRPVSLLLAIHERLLPMAPLWVLRRPSSLSSTPMQQGAEPYFPKCSRQPPYCCCSWGWRWLPVPMTSGPEARCEYTKSQIFVLCSKIHILSLVALKSVKLVLLPSLWNSLSIRSICWHVLVEKFFCRNSYLKLV